MVASHCSSFLFCSCSRLFNFHLLLHARRPSDSSRSYTVLLLHSSTQSPLSYHDLLQGATAYTPYHASCAVGSVPCVVPSRGCSCNNAILRRRLRWEICLFNSFQSFRNTQGVSQNQRNMWQAFVRFLQWKYAGNTQQPRRQNRLHIPSV